VHAVTAPQCGANGWTLGTAASRRVAFSSTFLVSGFFCSQTESTPTHLPVTQTAAHTKDNKNLMTTHSFQCPSCGAPLLPSGSSAVIGCPHCGISVIVPEELRQVSTTAHWATLLLDGFTSNDNDWLVSSQPSEYFAKLNRTVADGRYRWDAQTGRASSITTAWLMGYPVSDFHLIVNCKHIKGSRAGSGCGVIFRIQDGQNYYWFRITASQFFAISVIKDDQWQNIMDWTKSDSIKPKGVNEVEVIGHETHFTFVINGQIVSEIDDDHFSQGLVGLAIEGYTAGEEITFDFIDITLRAQQ
jgi:predicted RNA-binding Zn-ribbon protein involved in translation (DUF1610 family)